MKNEVKQLMSKKPADFVAVVKENLDRKRDAVIANKSYIFSQEVASSFKMEHVNESVELDEGFGKDRTPAMLSKENRPNFGERKRVKKDNVEPGEEAPEGVEYYTTKKPNHGKLVSKAHAHVKRAFKLLKKIKGLNEEEMLELEKALTESDAGE